MSSQWIRFGLILTAVVLLAAGCTPTQVAPPAVAAVSSPTAVSSAPTAIAIVASPTAVSLVPSQLPFRRPRQLLRPARVREET